ncbi:TrkH family potassium uptake protein [Algiphilus sp.]|uniref:TrkH family potassium uptake protein n=3 Tax=Algiphilus sp. TaxID=1872431 RepID=UPI001CA792B9|nr:TrkH family potassium uptake protein [Algiphilus acroporae]
MRLPQLQHRYTTVQRVVGLLLMAFSSTMLPPIVVDGLYREGVALAFVWGFLITLAFGALLWFPVHRHRRELKIREGFLVVVLFWTVLSLFAAIPLYIALTPRLNVAQAVFEAVSGLTTTGATVITGLDSLPHAVLYYRQQMQWLGGMGIIVLAVAILPLLGVGGMQIYRAEVPGPIKDNKLTPRIKETARVLWQIYLTLTIACGVAYYLAGMTPFDAVGHAFSTVATGGFSTHDRSIGFYESQMIELICVAFMIASSINFGLHFAMLRQKHPLAYWRDAEFRTFIAILGAGVALITVVLWMFGTYGSGLQALRQALFQVVSIGTTAGFTTADYNAWPSLLAPLLLFGSFAGGCAASTTGGIKVVRIALLFKQGIREVVRMIHPNAELPIKIGHRKVPDRVVQAVWGFFSVYMGFYLIIFFLMMAAGLDVVTAFSAVAATLNNLGPGLGDVASNFGVVPDFGLWVGIFAMLLGRLEIFPLLVLLTPYFWRR